MTQKTCNSNQSPLVDTNTQLKVSRYVTKIDLPEVEIALVYSGISGLLLDIPGPYINEANKLLQQTDVFTLTEQTEITKLFIDSGVLIPAEWDEYTLLRNRNLKNASTLTGNLALTICPTLNCNFRCIYCYQHHLQDVMSESVQDNLLAFIQSREPKTHKLFVTWFGGEPLLAKGVIDRLSEKFLKTFTENSSYHAEIVTNGFLLTPEISSHLADIGIRKVQITLDGPREWHNKRRILIGKKPTFDTIIENILSCDQRLAISLRVNVDQTNAEQMPLLFDQIDEAKLKGRVSLYFAPVKPYTEVCSDIASNCLSDLTWSKLQSQLSFEALHKGYGGMGLPRSMGGVCIADNPNGFVIRPDGMMFKCWNDVTQPHNAIGNINNINNSTDSMKKNRAKWQTWDPCKLEECKNCKILPQCLGGCPYLALEQKDKSRGACKELKHNLSETIATYYLGVKRRESAKKLMTILHEAHPDIVPNPNKNSETS